MNITKDQITRLEELRKEITMIYSTIGGDGNAIKADGILDHDILYLKEHLPPKTLSEQIIIFDDFGPAHFIPAGGVQYALKQLLELEPNGIRCPDGQHGRNIIIECYRKKIQELAGKGFLE